jgi:hypothetical protein
MEKTARLTADKINWILYSDGRNTANLLSTCHHVCRLLWNSKSRKIIETHKCGCGFVFLFYVFQLIESYHSGVGQCCSKKWHNCFGKNSRSTSSSYTKILLENASYQKQNKILLNHISSRSQWPTGLRYEMSSPARTLGSWVRIPLKASMSVLCAFILCFCVVLSK